MLERIGWLVLIVLILLAGCEGQTREAEPTAQPSPTPTEGAAPVAPVVTPIASPTPLPLPTAPLPSAVPSPQPAVGPISYEPDRRPVAVVVENEKAARPQSGLGQADVVYEAVAEWNLTRFVAVFSSNPAETVGPVRSGRAYHAAIAAEYDAVLAQCLGVPSVQAVLAVTRVFGLDGCRMLNPVGFWRDSSRRAPHNLYVSAPVLQKVATGKGAAGLLGKRELWPLVGPTVERITFVYPEDHEVSWRYDEGRQQYLRWQDGAPHLNFDGDQLGANSVIVQFVGVRDSSYYGENGYHELTLTGAGEALIYSNLLKRTARWQREDLDGRTHFFDEHGAEILLPPGPVFVQLVATGTVVHED